MTYNLSFTDTSVTFYDILIGVNTQMNDGLALLMLAVLFFITFIVYNKAEEDAVQSLMLSGFFTTIITAIFWAAALVDIRIIFIPLVIFVFTLLAIVFR